MAKVTKVRDFTHGYDYAAFSAVRVNNNLVAELGGRNAWVRICSKSVSLIRRVRGVGDSAGLPKDAIELDYDSRHDLHATGERDADGFHACDLDIQRASRSDKLRAHWANPNVAYRVPFQIAMVGLVLGVIGLALGVLSLIK